MKFTLDDKRKILVYIVMFFWVAFGILAIIYSTDFAELAVYFLSLTGFVGIYVWGESARKSHSKSVIQVKRGTKSSREIITYITIVLWATVGTLAIINETSLVSISAYYSALTPFVGAFILGETYKQSVEKYRDVKKIQDDILPEDKYAYVAEDNDEDGGNENPNMEF